MAVKKENEQLRTSEGKKAMIAALRKSMGIVSNAAKKCGISRETHRLWMKEDMAYADEVNLIKDDVVDFVEGKALQRVNEGSDTMIIFLLKTQGKDRGYIERSEIHQTNIMQELSDEEIKAQLKESLGRDFDAGPDQ